MVKQGFQIMIAGACVLGVASLCLAQAGGIYDAPKLNISIDGDLSDWSGPGHGVLSHSHDHGQAVNGGSNVPLQIEIRFAWDDFHLYTLVQEAVADDDPDEGADAADWTSEGGGPVHPWNTDSVGFYEGTSHTNQDTGRQAQWWVGLSSSTDADQIRHQARPPDALYFGDAANNITDGLRAVEFRMLWDEIRFEEGDLGAVTNHLDLPDMRDSPSHTLEDVGPGYIFRNDPLLVDGAIGANHVGQAFPGGASQAEGVAPPDRSFVRLITEPELPGDLDMDGDVDFTDFSVLAFNFTGTLEPFTGGYLPEEGDLDGDEDIDFADFSILAFNFTGTIAAPASDLPDDGNVHLEINVDDGAMTLQPNNANLAGYSIRSPDSQLVPDADGVAAPFLFYLLNAPQEVTAGTVGAATALTEDLVLDITFDGDRAQAENVVFQYTRAGEVTPVDGIIHVIPEPTTLVLLTIGAVALLRRRAA